MPIFNLESPLMQKLSLLWDLMVLNVLTIIASLPVFTIGAALTALYDVVFRMDTQREKTSGHHTA